MKNSDLDIITEARQRAQNAAAQGSSEARSGLIGAEFAIQNYVGLLLREARTAAETWAQWHAINDALGDPEAKSGLKLYSSPDSLDIVRGSLLRDALLGAYRLSDPFDRSTFDVASIENERFKFSLCGIAKYLEVPERRERLKSVDWVVDLGCPLASSVAQAQKNAGLIESFLRNVVPLWKIGNPYDRTFLDLRDVLFPWRQRFIAHASGLTVEPEAFILGHLDDFIKSTLRLTTDMHFVFTGATGWGVEADGIEKACQEEASKFWRPFFRSLADRRRAQNAEFDEELLELTGNNKVGSVLPSKAQ